MGLGRGPQCGSVNCDSHSARAENLTIHLNPNKGPHTTPFAPLCSALYSNFKLCCYIDHGEEDHVKVYFFSACAFTTVHTQMYLGTRKNNF